MGNFHVGQHVVRIKHGPSIAAVLRVGWKIPLIGRVYTVRAVNPYPETYEEGHILLEEIVNPVPRVGREQAWRADTFRPLKKLKVEDFAIVDEPVKENAL